LVDHSPLLARGFTVDNADDEAALLADLGVPLVLSGHIHQQDAAQRTQGNAILTDAATNSLAVYPNQFGVVTYDPSAATLAYRSQPVDVEGWARATGVQDPELLGYEAWSSQWFGDRIKARVADPAQAAVLAELNRRTFSGTEGLNADGLTKTAAYADLVAGDDFLALYASTLAEDAPPDDNQFVVTYPGRP